MKPQWSSFRLLLVFGVLLLSGLQPVPSHALGPALAPPFGGVLVSGYVYRYPSNQGISGARVSITGCIRRTFTDFSDEYGYYRIFVPASQQNLLGL